MNHEISSRALTPEEAFGMKRRVQIGMKGLADDVVFFVLIAGGLIIVGIGVAVAAGWLAGKLGFGGLGRLLTIVILIVSALIGAHAGVSAVRQSRRSRRLTSHDLDDRKVEVIRVENARLVQQEEFNDEGPLYYFGIDRTTVLFLGGQWLYDSDVYGVDTEEPLFPSSSFILHRLPSGSVLRIELTGGQLAPEAVLPRKTRLPAWLDEPFKKGFLGDSMMVEGDFEELLAAHLRSPASTASFGGQPARE